MRAGLIFSFISPHPFLHLATSLLSGNTITHNRYPIPINEVFYYIKVKCMCVRLNFNPTYTIKKRKNDTENVIDMNILQVLAICGMLSPIVYTIMWILGGVLQQDYSHIRDDISSLFAVNAPNKGLMQS